MSAGRQALPIIAGMFVVAGAVIAAPPPAPPPLVKDAGWLESRERGRVFLNRAPLGGPVRIGNRSHRSGIGMAAPVMVFARFSEPTLEFAASLGVDQNPLVASDPNGPSVRFIIWADGRRVFTSEVFTRRHNAREVRLPLPRVRDLILAVDDGPVGPRPRSRSLADHAVWGEPRVRLESGAWIAVADLPWRSLPPRKIELATGAGAEGAAAGGPETLGLAALARPGRASHAEFWFP